MQGSGLHTHSISVSVRHTGHINPCGEIELDENDRCTLSAIRPVGEPIGWMVPDWTALDDIVYALKEDELAAVHGPVRARQMIEEEIESRRRKVIDDLFSFFNNHTHNVSRPGFGPSFPSIIVK